MSKCLIATFGWTEQFVLSSILRHGVGMGDQIVLLVPDKKDEKSEAILRDFGSFLSKYGEGVKLKVERVPLDNFDDAVTKISKIFREILSMEPERVIINLSGGMRVLILATYIAALLTCPRNVVIELETENRERNYHIPNLSIKGLVELTDIDRMILGKVEAEEEIDTSKLLQYLKIPRSTLHKHLRELESKGLINLERKGKLLHVSITPLGKFLSIAAE